MIACYYRHHCLEEGNIKFIEPKDIISKMEKRGFIGSHYGLDENIGHGLSTHCI